MKGEFEIMEFWMSGYSDGTSCGVYGVMARNSYQLYLHSSVL
jgi:hypothetical protein